MSFEYGAKPANQVNQPNKIEYLFKRKTFLRRKVLTVLNHFFVYGTDLPVSNVPVANVPTCKKGTSDTSGGILCALILLSLARGKWPVEN